jgi:hypothetical protein
MLAQQGVFTPKSSPVSMTQMVYDPNKFNNTYIKKELETRKKQNEPNCKHLLQCSQWLIAQLVECSLSVMKDPGSNLGKDICPIRYGPGI